ncbi:MAG: Fe-S cluster assembly protein SufD [Hyphomicrobiaceae bacterium]|nr:Fe-S cluster assembly protein SufD [Hyphomicrobiaceae bacterium]
MTNLSRARSEAETQLRSLFDAALPHLAGDAAAREAALSAVEAAGLPTRRVEAFKYTDLRALIRSLAPLAGAAGTVALPDPLLEGACRIVLVDGAYHAGLSSPGLAGLTVTPLAEALRSGDAAVSVPEDGARVIERLNAAFAGDGVVLAVEAGAVIETPVEVLHIATQAASSFARVELRVGAGASVEVVERFVGEAGALQRNAVTRVALDAGASAEILRVQDENQGATHLGVVDAQMEAEARFGLVHVALGGALSRVETRLRFCGENGEAKLGGLTYLTGRQHGDHTLVVEHAVANCNSRELFKSAIDGRAKSIFQGKIIVSQDAQKTDGQMGAHAVLLSEDAEAVSKPELEIFADDVVCAHGATVGALDDDLLFYLLARGIPRKEAERLLLMAFLAEAFELIENEALREAVGHLIEERLSAR